MVNNEKCSSKFLCPVSFGLAIGITKGLYLIGLAWFAKFTTHGVAMVHMMGQFIHGYAPTFVGGLKGGLCGLIAGFVFGFLVGVIYDMFAACCARCSQKCWACHHSDQNNNPNNEIR